MVACKLYMHIEYKALCRLSLTGWGTHQQIWVRRDLGWSSRQTRQWLLLEHGIWRLGR